MALFVTTMIMLFAFTTNIGMLVHAKINLQNAADAAAYAGAATQARQLTAAAYLNWEMRRALKEFLFYVDVRSQYAAMPCFPLNSNADRLSLCGQRPGDERYDFGFVDPRENNNETNGPFIPSVCVIFDRNNNYCQKAGVPGIPEFPSGGGWGVADPIVAAVRSATNQIISKKLEDCQGRTEINQQFLISWLFNFYPFRDPTALLSTGKDSDDPFPFSNGLERLGYLPRAALIRARIDNFEEALNLNLANEGVGSVTITDQTMAALRGATSAVKTLDYYERPIQAFLSAKNNLPTVGDDNGNFAEIELTELLPNRAANVEVNPNLKNPPVLVKFNDLVSKATFANSKFEQIAGQDRGNCYQFREARIVNRFPFGVTKDPTVLTYYAVRLQAKARLLFSPFGGNGIVTLSAYSAAKPFGSRIGKHLNPENSSDGALQMMMARAKLGRQFVAAGGGTIDDSIEFISSFSPMHPNVLVADGDTTSEEQGFSANAHLGYLRAAIAFFGRLDFGVRLAGAYAPWEIGYYTPPANYNKNIQGLFEDNPKYDGKFFSLVAPVYPVNGAGGDLTFIRDRVRGYLVADVDDMDTLEGAQFKAFLETIMSDARFSVLTDYMNATKETTFHYIPDPMLSDVPELEAYAQSVGRKWTVAGMDNSYQRQLTSWNNQKTAADSDAVGGIQPNSELGLDMGRSGYSVKFTSFSSLKKGGVGTNDPGQVGSSWTNPLERLDAGGAATRIFDDINKLKH